MAKVFFVRVFRDPLFIFLVLGACVFTVYEFQAYNSRPLIKLDAVTRAKLIQEHEAITGKQANLQTIAKLEREYLIESVFFHELIKQEFHLKDPKTRANLIDYMYLHITSQIPPINEEDLLTHYAENIKNYYSPETRSFEHVFFEELPLNHDTLLRNLREQKAANGQVFLHGNVFNQVSEGIVQGIFGEQFASDLFASEAKDWVGPIESRHGYHFINTRQIHAPRVQSFQQALNAVRNDFLEQQQTSAIEDKFNELISGFDVQIDQ
jgi:parvulin-like peptidyl-prolyl isomerase